MSLIFRTKVPEISGSHNGRQDQLFRVDARAHRPPLHGAHSIYQSKLNHLEQMTLVALLSVRLTLRLSVFCQLYFKVPDMTLSGCCLDQHSVQVYSAAKPRIITCRDTANSRLNSLFLAYIMFTLFFFPFLHIFSPRTCIQRLLHMEFNGTCSSIYGTDIPVTHQRVTVENIWQMDRKQRSHLI